MTTDIHFHAAVLGDDPAFGRYGRIAPWMRRGAAWHSMLRNAGIRSVSDIDFQEAIERALDRHPSDRVVVLALDPVRSPGGQRRKDLSSMWLDGSYVTDVLRPTFPRKVLYGASVHPYDPMFSYRVSRERLEQGAVLCKWLPSAQRIDLSHPLVGSALEALARAELPLLLHVGPEYAIPSSDPRTASYDYLSWGRMDRIRNLLRRPSRRLFAPDVEGIRRNLERGLMAGGKIVFAHCGLPYFAPRALSFLEHSELDEVSRYLRDFRPDGIFPRSAFADVSACSTPIRQTYFPDLQKLPRGSLLFGSDWPTPSLTISNGWRGWLRDLLYPPEDPILLARGELEWGLKRLFPEWPEVP